MITFPMLPGVEVNLFLLIFVCLGAGVLSGFSGVGGAFIITPALIILGLPANFAVGTSLAWVMGNSVIGTFRHSKLGNVDFRFGLVMTAIAMFGVEAGVNVINLIKGIGLADEVVLSISVVMLFTVGIFTLLESLKRKREIDSGRAGSPRAGTALSRRLQGINIPPLLHFPASGVTMSLWIIIALGFFIGTLMGIMGVGGGFILVPALVYAIGLTSFMAVGTSLFQIIFSAAYGTIRHTMSGNVIIFAAIVMIIASSTGVRFGTLVTRGVRGFTMRLILSISILTSALGVFFKLLSTLQGGISWLESSSVAVTFGGIGLAMIMIIALFILATRYRCGRHVPCWTESCLAKDGAPVD